MSKEDSLVQLCFTEPALFFCGKEDLDGDILSAPLSLPYFSITTFTNTPHQVNLLRNCSLNLQILMV